MTGGYMGKLLFVDLSTAEIREDTPDEGLYRDFIGGYGVGSRVLYDRQKARADPLGPDNIFGYMTGPLTGTPAIGGTRYQVMARSPLTLGWGDANSGGFFGPYLKFAGYDGIFISGISEKPVYLAVINGKAELKDASHLWGRTTYETEDILAAEYGKSARVSSIGPAGEKLSRIACVITHKGDAAGRSGLGAVLGSKRLKAVVVDGDMKVPIADVEMADRIRADQQEALKEKRFLERFHKYGTSGHGDMSAASGDTPIMNWAGIGGVDLPDVSGLHRDNMISNVKQRFGCWRCPCACKASLNAGKGDFNYPEGIQRVEYETIGAFGGLCMNTNAESIQMAGHLCNAYGMDTISAGAMIAFAMECYEKGILTKADTDGIDLKWGDPKAIVQMTEKLVKREGLGDILADGVRLAAERIGNGSGEYAVHIDGQDLGMHDPKLPVPRHAGHASAAMYKMDATPGRHTQSFGPNSFRSHLSNAMGVCMIPLDQTEGEFGPYQETYMKAITGLDRPMAELLKAGERIANMRHVFNLREGINPLERYVHPRIIGAPPQEDGPLRGVTLDIDEECWWNLGALDWDRVTTKPSKAKLLELGLNDIAEELYPPQQGPGFGPP